MIDLEPQDIVSSQRVSSRLLKLARDNRLWRYKCFEKAPSAAAATADKPDALANLTGALGGLSLSETPRPTAGDSDRGPRPSKRAKKAADWDRTVRGESIDWYSEYIQRHAPLSTIWCDSASQDIRGIALHQNSQKVVSCVDDGSIRIYDIRDRPYHRRKFEEVGRSTPGVLFDRQVTSGESSSKSRGPIFNGVVECISVDSHRQRAFCAVEETLNEVDLDTLQVISQSPFAWPITALSAQGDSDVSLSVGTSWSLHLYDSRAPFRDRSRSPEDLLRTTPGDPEESIAFFPNYTKAGYQSSPYNGLPTSPAPSSSQIYAQMMGNAARRPRRVRTDISDYAQIEPGPLSIMHHGDNEILIAGRFPSILSYDRRTFPRLQYVVHSGARLSSLATIPHPPRAAQANPRATATLIACGEYGGRGSLELYSLPHDQPNNKQQSGDFGLGDTSPELGAADRKHAIFSTDVPPYTSKNRQEASSSKLLSVATQGTRIVFSDAEGGIKWVERDGRGLARRWNINAWQVNNQGGSHSGELVARKMVPLSTMESERGDRGDSDLLIWTGERIGLVTTRPRWEDHEELVKSFEEPLDPREMEDRAKEEEYSRTMRAALERQADERRWMSQFRLKRGLF